MIKRMTEKHGDFPLEKLSTRMVLDIEADMSGLAPTTIRTNMAALWALIRWGVDQNQLPDIRRPRNRTTKRNKRQQNHAGGKPLLMEEIERMIAAVEANPMGLWHGATLQGKPAKPRPLRASTEPAEPFMRGGGPWDR